MTWDQLGAAITTMTREEREREVKFVEPYDEDREVYGVQFEVACGDFAVGGSDEADAIVIRRGESYLSV